MGMRPSLSCYIIMGGDTAKAAVNSQPYNVPAGVTIGPINRKGGAAGSYVTGSFFEGFLLS